MDKIFVVKSGPDKGAQVWPCSQCWDGQSLYNNLQSDPESGTFYASTSFSYLWTDTPRQTWGRDEVEEITPHFAVKAIVNHGSEEEHRFTRYFENEPRLAAPWSAGMVWLNSHLNFRSQYNPYLVGLCENPWLRGWVAAWEWETSDGRTVQLRRRLEGGNNTIISGPLVECPTPYRERAKKYAQEKREATLRACDYLANDTAHRAWQESMRQR